MEVSLKIMGSFVGGHEEYIGLYSRIWSVSGVWAVQRTHHQSFSAAGYKQDAQSIMAGGAIIIANVCA